MPDIFLDERCISLYRSPSGLTHVGSGYDESVCGSFVKGPYWQYTGLTSLRRVGRMSRDAKANRMCKLCAREYEDVKDYADFR
jgi:hypothetical protein